MVRTFGLVWYRCYYPHRSRDALSPVCGIFTSLNHKYGPLYILYIYKYVYLITMYSDDCVIEDDTNYWGHDIAAGQLTAESLEACAWLCQVEAACSFWTFESSAKLCFLKTSDVGRRTNNKYKSGTQACWASGKQHGVCYYT